MKANSSLDIFEVSNAFTHVINAHKDHDLI